MAAFEHVSSVCTLAVLPRGALAGAASRGRENIGSGSVDAERIGWSFWVAWPMGLVSSGDRATRALSQGWEVSLNFRRFRCCWAGKRGRRLTGARADRARAGCCPIYTIGR